MRYSSGFVAIGPALLAIAGCGGETDPAGHSTSEALSPCEPLASVEQPITLGTIIAVGRAEDDTLYVADDGDGGEGRVFVSQGDELLRVRVVGSGEGNSRDTRTYLYIFEDGDGHEWTLAIGATADGTRMVLAEGEAERDFDAIAAEGQQLSLVDESALRGLDVRNLPGDIEIEYFARTEEGASLVVTRPRDDWSYEDFRLFYGEGSALREEHVLDVLRAKDGGTTQISFELDGHDALAYFPSPLSSRDESASLTVHATAEALTELDVADGLDELSFECFEGS